MTHTLNGQVAIITGASRGLGAQMARDIARAGAAVTLFARSAKPLQALAEEITAAGGRALAIAGDVANRQDVESAVARTRQAFGPVTLLLNNAGVDKPYGAIGVADPDEWWAAQAIHVRGALLFMSAVIPQMRQQRKGRILNVTSLAATLVAPGVSSYCVAKSTLVRLTEHVHAENQDIGIPVFAFHPGAIFTDMARSTIADPEAQKWAKPVIDMLEAVKDKDQRPAMERLGRQAVALAGGGYDVLAGRYIDLDVELDTQLAQHRAGAAPAKPGH